MPNVAVLGGTFDPPHLGHMELAKAVLESNSSLANLYFVPTGQNPLKPNQPAAPAQSRLEMVKLGVNELAHPKIDVLSFEVDKPPPHYTIDLVDALLWQCASVTLVMGSEVFRQIPKWKDPQRLISLCDIIVVSRDDLIPDIEGTLGHLKTRITGRNQSQIFHERGRTITYLPVQLPPYSATQIRSELAQGGEMPQGIQRSVWRYIKENQLYAVK